MFINSNLIHQLIKQSGYDIRKEDFNFQLKSCSSYPQLDSIRKTLDFFKVESIFVNVDKNDLEVLSKIFLAEVSIEDENQLLFIEKKNGIIIIDFSDGKKIKMSNEEFKNIWTGFIIAIEENISSSFRLSFFEKLFILMLVVLTAGYLVNGILWSAVFFLSSIGLSLSIFLTRIELSRSDVSSNDVCKRLNLIKGYKNDCGTLSSSKFGKIYKEFNLGDLSLIYFFSYSCFLVFFGFESNILFYIGLAALPVIIFSIVIQFFLLKKTCLFCLLLNVTLFLQLLLTIINNDFLKFNFIKFFNFLLIFLIAFFIWFNYKKMYLHQMEKSEELILLKRFYYNPKLFLNVLGLNKIKDFRPIPDNFSISFGNVINPVLHIIGITNPICHHCKDAVNEYSKILDKYSENVRIDIIFCVQPDENLEEYVVSNKIVEIYGIGTNNAMLALLDWFKNQNYDEWILNYGMPYRRELDMRLLKEHFIFSNNCEIEITPTTIVNGSFMPNEYKVSDLTALIPHLIEESTKS